MANPTLYKKVPLNQVNNNTPSPLTASEQQEINSTLTKFFELFTAEHS